MKSLPQDALRALVSKTAFGGKIISNMYRGLVAEAIVAHALGNAWKWCSADWAGWDFEHRVSGLRLEVKQTSDLQSWEKTSSRPVKTTFGIPTGKGYWEGEVWKEHVGRRAQLYIFAHHAHPDRATADHFDMHQWKFLTLPEKILPHTQSVSIKKLNDLASSIALERLGREHFVSVDQLSSIVERMLTCCKTH